MKSKPVPFSRFDRMQQEILNWNWATAKDQFTMEKVREEYEEKVDIPLREKRGEFLGCLR